MVAVNCASASRDVAAKAKSVRSAPQPPQPHAVRLDHHALGFQRIQHSSHGMSQAAHRPCAAIGSISVLISHKVAAGTALSEKPVITATKR
jgi:hypothetical protein